MHFQQENVTMPIDTNFKLRATLKSNKQNKTPLGPDATAEKIPGLGWVCLSLHGLLAPRPRRQRGQMVRRECLVPESLGGSSPGAPGSRNSWVASRALGREAATGSGAGRVGGGGQGAEQKPRAALHALQCNWIFGEMALSSLQGETADLQTDSRRHLPSP